MAAGPERVQQIESGGGRVGTRHRRGATLEAAGARRPVERVEAEGKGIDAPEPAGGQRLEPLDELAAHVEEGDAGRTEQVLQRAGDEEVDAEGVHVERRGPGPLVVVEHQVGAALAAQGRQRRDVDPVAVPEAHVRRRDDQRPLVDARLVALDRQRVAAGRHPVDDRAAPLLGQPAVRHGRELELAQQHPAAVAVEAQRGGDRADGGGGAGHDRDLVGRGADRRGQRRAQPFDLADPALPRRAVVSHDVANASSAALTSTDSAPWEHLFT